MRGYFLENVIFMTKENASKPQELHVQFTFDLLKLLFGYCIHLLSLFYDGGHYMDMALFCDLLNRSGLMVVCLISDVSAGVKVFSIGYRFLYQRNYFPIIK